MNNLTFSDILEKFFKTYLPGEIGVSRNSIRSYRDTFVLFFEYMDSVNKVKPDKISLSHFKKEEILRFLKWLEEAIAQVQEINVWQLFARSVV